MLARLQAELYMWIVYLLPLVTSETSTLVQLERMAM